MTRTSPARPTLTHPDVSIPATTCATRRRDPIGIYHDERLSDRK